MHGTDSRLNTDLCVITEFDVVNEKQHLIRSHCVATWTKSCKLIRDAALKSSNKAAARMIARHLNARTPTEYHVNDEVLVRFPDIRPGRRRKQKYNRLITCLQGKVTAADPETTSIVSNLRLQMDEIATGGLL